MKLRIKGDSLRLRLTQGEVQLFAMNGIVEDRIRFGTTGVLVYRLNRDVEAALIYATFRDSTIDVYVPAGVALRWCGTDEVTLEDDRSGGGIDPRIIVEKDFACLKPRADEDESDNFPNPQASNC